MSVISISQNTSKHFVHVLMTDDNDDDDGVSVYMDTCYSAF